MGVFGVCQCFQIMHPSIALHCNLMLCMICVLAALCALCKFYDVALPSPMLQLSLSVDFQIPGQPPPSSRFSLRLTHHKYSRLVAFGRSLKEQGRTVLFVNHFMDPFISKVSA